jgi:hypothetical protein
MTASGRQRAAIREITNPTRPVASTSQRTAAVMAEVAATTERSNGPSQTAWGGRPSRAKTYGKKRERGQNSCKIVPLSLDLVRIRYRLPVYCVQSWRTSRNRRDAAAAVGVLHAANRGPDAADDFACNTDPWAIACLRFHTGSTAHCLICPDPGHCVQDATVRFRAEGPSAPNVAFRRPCVRSCRSALEHRRPDQNRLHCYTTRCLTRQREPIGRVAVWRAHEPRPPAHHCVVEARLVDVACQRATFDVVIGEGGVRLPLQLPWWADDGLGGVQRARRRASRKADRQRRGERGEHHIPPKSRFGHKVSSHVPGSVSDPGQQSPLIRRRLPEVCPQRTIGRRRGETGGEVVDPSADLHGVRMSASPAARSPRLRRLWRPMKRGGRSASKVGLSHPRPFRIWG